MTRLSARQDRNRNRKGPASLQAELADLIGMDVVHARRYRNHAGGMTLTTQSSLAPKTLALEHLPAEVSYEVRKIGAESWLVRKQSLPRGGRLTELVCSGVSAIRLETPGKQAKGKMPESKALPAAVEVKLVLQDAGADEITLPYRTKWSP